MERHLMTGNEAIARGAYEAGVKVCSAYPGTPSTEIFENLPQYKDALYSEWAPNEKVAAEVAYGASIAGVRSLCAMKHVGLNVAADPLYTMAYTGVNAGLVIGVADDPGMHSSQNEQDSRHHAIAAKVPMLEPSDSAEALEFAKLAYTISEQFDTPVLLKMCTRVAHSQSLVETSDRVEPEMRHYEKNIAKYVMMPGNAIRRHPFVEERTRKLQEWAEAAPVNRVEPGRDHKIGIITSSTSYQYVKEVFGDSVSVLKLGMANPLPVKLIKDFACKVEKLVVVEEMDPIIENHCKALGLAVSGKDVLPMEGEFSQNLIAEKLGGAVHTGRTIADPIPPRPPVMCAGCPHRGLFYTLKQNKLTVLGDIGCYTLGGSAPLNALDSVVCMGGGFTVAMGMARAFELAGQTDKKVFGVMGDSTFFHTILPGLVNAAYHNANMLLIVLDNSATAMTGFQPHPGTGLTAMGDQVKPMDIPKILDAVGCNVEVADPFEVVEAEKALRRMLDQPGMNVLIMRQPCATLMTKERSKKPVRVYVDQDVCVGDGCGCDKYCSRVWGCPGNTWDFKKNKALIDPVTCVGCGVCAKLCPSGAIKVERGDKA